jgi:transcriptional regulator with XRE-family HTH domain
MASGVTLADLAQRMRRPTSEQELAAIECGTLRPGPTLLMELSAELGVRPSWLLGAPPAPLEPPSEPPEGSLRALMRLDVDARRAAILELPPEIDPEEFAEWELGTLRDEA